MQNTIFTLLWIYLDAAWTDDDDKVIFAMKKGLELTITGESSRGQLLTTNIL